MSETTLIDGKIWFDGIAPERFYSDPDSIWVKTYLRNGNRAKPSLTKVSSDNVTYVHISHNKLLALCPNCNSAEYVWRDGPHVVICAECGNADINGMARKVVMPSPDELHGIETLLQVRPNPANRNWIYGEGVPKLLAENIENGIMAGDEDE